MKLALFDLDNTLLAGDSDYQWGRYLIATGQVDPIEHAAANERFYHEYVNGTLNIDDFLKFQLSALADNPRAQLEIWRQNFLNQYILPLISPAAQKCVDEHLAAGHLCAVVTATNSFVVHPIVQQFRIPHLIATVPATDAAGEFTGAVRGEPSFRHGKIIRVNAWLESLGLHWCNFSQSWFYSDSHNDLPLLEIVSNPVVINPDETLSNVANTRGWPQFNWKMDAA